MEIGNDVLNKLIEEEEIQNKTKSNLTSSQKRQMIKKRSISLTDVKEEQIQNNKYLKDKSK